jgi:TetR/AcrR family transcriptional regulator, transcriptional repressor for nem operon
MPPRTRSNGTRERILEAGAQAIGTKSFEGCGLAEILDLAGVPKGSFYHYFGSKEDFGIALIEKAAEEFLELLRPIVGDRRRSPVKRLRAIFEKGRDECAANGAARQCLIPKLAVETSQLSRPVRAAVKFAYDQWAALLARVIREAQEAGEIDRRQDPVRLANVLVMLWEGATIRMQIDRSLQPVEDFLVFVFHSLLRPEEGGRPMRSAGLPPADSSGRSLRPPPVERRERSRLPRGRVATHVGRRGDLRP